MNHALLPKIILQDFTRWAVSYIRFARIRSRFPSIEIVRPVNLLYDDLNAIDIGNSVSIGAFSEIVVLANTPYSRVPGKLVIREKAVIGSHANIRAAGGSIVVGRNVLIGQNVSLIGANHSIGSSLPYRDLPWDEERTGITISDNVWIGAGCVVLPGVSIGSNSIIASGSIVTKSVAANEIWAGVPAAHMRSL